jgi:dCMP deaminase
MIGGNPMSERWDRHFLRLALEHARMSKDPSTKVGAVIVGPDREILSAGFNGLPRGIADTADRLGDRDTKLKLIVHGEMNAILAAARSGVRVKDCTLYMAATDASGTIWGGPPCVRCTVETIQAGIKEIVSWPMRTAPTRWHADLMVARELLEEAGIRYREIEGDA